MPELERPQRQVAAAFSFASFCRPATLRFAGHGMRRITIDLWSDYNSLLQFFTIHQTDEKICR
jgi:hypothetical protein